MIRPYLHFRFSDRHGFTKPNDERALRLMDHCAREVMEEYPDVFLAFGESDEFRYVRCAGCVFSANALVD